MTPDEQFFAIHKDRQCHIRTARPGESERKFRALGPHHVSRRRMLLWKMPAGSPVGGGKIAELPMLAFGDEKIEDTDAVLLPILNELMVQARDADMAAHPELYRRQ